MKRIASVFSTAALSVSLATASTAQLRLAASECGGAAEATWTCDSNTGTAVTLVASVIAPDAPPLTMLTGHESQVRFHFLHPVPAWWQIGTGRCRAASAMQVDLSAVASGCAVKMSDGGNLVGGTFYRIGPDITDPRGSLDERTARLTVVAAFQSIDPGAPWAPVALDEMALFTVTIGRQNTIGDAACAGCTECAVMEFERAVLTQPVGVGDHWLYSNGDPSTFVSGQGHWYECIVPTNRSTWGQVKSLYR